MVLLLLGHGFIFHLSAHALLAIGSGTDAAPRDLRHGDVLSGRGGRRLLDLKTGRPNVEKWG